MADFHIPDDPNWQWAYDAILYTVGERFPKGDPSQLQALDVELEQFGANLGSGIAATQALAAGLRGSLDGPAADAFAQFQQTITRPIPPAIRKALVAGQIADQANKLIDYVQTEITVAAFTIVLDIAAALATGFGASLVPAYLKIGQEVTGALLDWLDSHLHQLVVRLALEAAGEGVQEGAENVAAQTIVIAKGNSDGFNWSGLAESIGAGATIGAVAGGVHLIGGRYFPRLAGNTHGGAGLGAGGELLGEFVYLSMTGALDGFDPLATATSSLIGSYASRYAHDAGNALGGGPAGPDPSGVGPSRDLAGPGLGSGSTGTGGAGTDGKGGNRPRPDGSTNLRGGPLGPDGRSVPGTGTDGAPAGGGEPTPATPPAQQPPAQQPPADAGGSTPPAGTVDGDQRTSRQPGDPSGAGSRVPPPAGRTDLVRGPSAGADPGRGLPGFDAPLAGLPVDRAVTGSPDGAVRAPEGGPSIVERPATGLAPDPVRDPAGQHADPVSGPPRQLPDPVGGPSGADGQVPPSPQPLSPPPAASAPPTAPPPVPAAVDPAAQQPGTPPPVGSGPPGQAGPPPVTTGPGEPADPNADSSGTPAPLAPPATVPSAPPLVVPPGPVATEVPGPAGGPPVSSGPGSTPATGSQPTVPGGTPAPALGGAAEPRDRLVEFDRSGSSTTSGTADQVPLPRDATGGGPVPTPTGLPAGPTVAGPTTVAPPAAPVTGPSGIPTAGPSPTAGAAAGSPPGTAEPRAGSAAGANDRSVAVPIDPPSYLESSAPVPAPAADREPDPPPPPYEVAQSTPLSTPPVEGDRRDGAAKPPPQGHSRTTIRPVAPDPAPPSPPAGKVEPPPVPRPATTVEGPGTPSWPDPDHEPDPDRDRDHEPDVRREADPDRVPDSAGRPGGDPDGRTTVVPPGDGKAGPRGVAVELPPSGTGPSLRDVPPAVVAKATVETTCVGDPVDVTTGRVIYAETDLALPGLALERTHRSDYRWGRSFGPSWASTLDQRVVADGSRAWFLAADGSILSYPLPAEGRAALPVLGRPVPLRRLVGGGWSLTDGETLLLFAPAVDGQAAMLSDVATVRTRWHVARDGEGTPTRLESSSGDRVELQTRDGLVTGAWFVPVDADSDGVALPAFGYDERRRLVEVRNSSGDPVRLGYDADGRIVRWEDRNGEWYTYAYDGAGRCVRTDGSGGHLRYTFGYGDGVTIVTDSLGGVHRYELDDNLQVTAVTDPLGVTTRTAWDPTGRSWSRTDPLGRVTRFAYDEAGRQVATVRPDGSPYPVAEDGGWADGVPGREFDLDGLGRLRSVRLPDGVVTEFGWTAEGDLAWRTGPDGSTQQWHYDGEGNLVETIDAQGRSAHIEYGAFDLPTARIDEAGNRTEFTYDTELRLVAVTNPAGRVWRYSYDPAGRLTTETDFDGRTQRYGYDAAGQLTSRTNATGDTVHYVHDLLGRVVERRAGGAVTRLEYDDAGHLARVRSPDAVVRFERDAEGRIVAETINGRTVRTSYQGEQALTRTTPSGRSSRWTLDAQGRPVMLATGAHVVRFDHDAAGREISRTVDDVVALRQTFDEAGRLTAQHVAEAAVRGFGYDATDRVVAITDTLDGDRSFHADETGRIHTVTAGGTERERYEYDAAGNLVGTGAGRWEFAGGTLLRSDDARFTYDGKGRLTTRIDAAGSWRFSWDAEDRLTHAVTPGGDRWRYRYDGFGRRIAKQRLAADDTVLDEVTFSWAGDLMVEQTDGTGTVSWDYRPDGSAPVTQTNGDDRLHTVVTDAVGTPTHLVESGGQLRWWSRGDLWGRTGDPAGTPLRFPGQYHDTETGLHYNRFRYYDPATARYLSPDPLGLAGGPNPTAYVDDPLTSIDPLGLAPCKPGKRKSGSGHRSSRHSSHHRHSSHGEPSSLPPEAAPPATDELVGGPQPELEAAFGPYAPLADDDQHALQYSVSQLSSEGSSYNTLQENLPPLPPPGSRIDFQQAQRDWEKIEYRMSRYDKLWKNSEIRSAYEDFKKQLELELQLKDQGRSDAEIDAEVVQRLGSDKVEPFAQLMADNHAFSVPAKWWQKNQKKSDFDTRLTQAVEDYRSHLALWGKIGPAVAERIADQSGSRMLEASPGGQIFDNVMLGASNYDNYPPGFTRLWEKFSYQLVAVTKGMVDAHVYRAVMVGSVLDTVEAKILFDKVEKKEIDGLRIVAWEFVDDNKIAKAGEYIVTRQQSYDERVPKLYRGKTSPSFDAHQQQLYEQRSYRREDYNRIGLQNSMSDVPPVERRDSNYIFVVSDASQPEISESPESITRKLSEAQRNETPHNPVAMLDQMLAVLEYAQDNQGRSGSDASVVDLTDNLSNTFLDSGRDRYGSGDSIPVPPTRNNSALDSNDATFGNLLENPGPSPRGSDYSPTLDAVPENEPATDWRHFNDDWQAYDLPAADTTRRDSHEVAPSEYSYRSHGSRRRSNRHPSRTVSDPRSRSGSSRTSSGSGSSHRDQGSPNADPGRTTRDPGTEETYQPEQAYQPELQYQSEQAYSQDQTYSQEQTYYPESSESYYQESSSGAYQASYFDQPAADQVVYADYSGVPFSYPPASSAKSTDETYCEADPIDVTTGRMILTGTDATLPGLPLVRTYRSDYQWGRSFGRSWASTLDQRVIVDGEQVRYLAADGSILTYPLVAEGATALPVLGRALPLRRLTGGGWLLTDPEPGRAWVFAPAHRGESLLSDVTDGGVRWSILRDDAGTVTELRSSSGATIEFSSAAGLITALRLPDQDGVLVEASRFTYDQDRQLTEVVNSSGDPERFAYADGRIVRWEDRNDEWYTYAYDEAGRCVDTDGKGGYLRYRFAYSDGLTVVTDSLGATRTYQLNDRFQVIAETDALGATTRHEWDDAYRLLSRTDPLGRTTTYEYGADGRPTVVTRPDGSRALTSFDEQGRATSWTDFDGSTVRREFDTDGRVLAEIDASGEVVRFDRPAENGRGTAIQVGPAVVVRDAARRVTAISTTDGDTRYTYDRLGRVVSITTDQGTTEVGWTLEGDLSWRENPDGSVEEFGYDGEGNLVETLDATGRRTFFEYGAFDLVTARIEEEGDRTEYAYDTELRLTTITNPAGETWRYTYDPNGRVTEETDFQGRTQRYAYDAAGQLVAHTDAAGAVTHFGYDLLGRVVERRTGDAVTRLTYDAADRLVSAVDADSEIRLERDTIGRIIAETVNGRTVTSSYGGQGDAVTARTRPSGAVTRWSYDESGRPTVLVAGGQQLRFAYDGGREVSRSWDAGLTIRHDTSRATAPDQGTGESGDVRYTLDAVGRPVTRSDAAGDWHLTWDNRDRLTTVTTPGGDSWHYRYDAFGRRITKQRRSAKGSVLEETGFVWSGDLLVEQHHRVGRGPVTTTAWEYHPTVAHPLVQIADGTVHAVLTDEAGTPTQVIGIDGSQPGEPGDIPLRSAGRYRDAETGLQYDGSRFFDPATARFLPEPRLAPVPVS
ncbi:DUF6531 domain-containing protein [Micromonospora sp. NPDC049081]|uniref:DUF6531 domain-containing protein n=1 Tax=Micromonospora sp. NPDC049081 TaxID=3155150 RepID=UPI0033DE610B